MKASGDTRDPITTWAPRAMYRHVAGSSLTTGISALCAVWNSCRQSASSPPLFASVTHAPDFLTRNEKNSLSASFFASAPDRERTHTFTIASSDLPVWQKAADTATRVFEWSQRNIGRGNGDLASQLQRATLSISNNIAEGFERGSTNELIHFLDIARGSAGEVRSMLCVMERMPAFAPFEI